MLNGIYTASVTLNQIRVSFLLQILQGLIEIVNRLVSLLIIATVNTMNDTSEMDDSTSQLKFLNDSQSFKYYGPYRHTPTWLKKVMADNSAHCHRIIGITKSSGLKQRVVP